ncbi:MAG: hypothetical protein LBK99_07220, partial [Opitutaceae bacterium]|nr:hypothetical protein [Opitutaceae bacterium]
MMVGLLAAVAGRRGLHDVGMTLWQIHTRGPTDCERRGGGGGIFDSRFPILDFAAMWLSPERLG